MKKLFLTAAAVLGLTLFSAGCGSANIEEGPGEYEKLYDYDLSGYVELGQYKGLELDIEGASDEAVHLEMIAGLILLGAHDELSGDTAIEEFDWVNIDLSGTVDGAEFERGAAEGYELLIGSDQFIPGFEDGLIGKRAGDEFLLNLTFPENYEDELAGRDVEFFVRINTIKRPVITDEAVRSISDGEFSTLKEFEEYVRGNLNNMLKISNADNLWEKVMENSRVINYPEKELRDMIAEIENYYRGEAEEAGMTWEEYLLQGGLTQAEADRVIIETAQGEVAREMVSQAIAALEGIEVTEEEYEEFRTVVISEMGYPTEELFKAAYGGNTLEQIIGKNVVEMRLLHNKVIEFICKHAVIK